MVNNKPPIVTPAIIDEYRRRINPATGKRYTLSDIARIYGVSRARISQIKNQVDRRYKTPRERAMEHFPWGTMPAKYHDASLNKLVRDHMEYMEGLETSSRDMSPARLRRLWTFYNTLDEGYVVEFDPEIPPSEGIKTGGFAYRPRLDSDNDLIIRVNQHTTLTDKGEVLLSMPSERPAAR